jgi:hypothetical protein
MLKKLLKHDMRTMAKTALPMLIISLVVSVVLCAMLYFTLSFSEEGVDNIFGVMMIVTSFYAMGIMAIAAMYIVVYILSLVRYYKSLFTDEGYLNMVLPVETTTMLNAKMLSTLIWFSIGAATTVLGIFIAVGLPLLLYNGEILAELVELLKYIMSFFISDAYAAPITVLQIIEIVIQFLESTVLVITAITIGASVMKKRRILGAILFYFGITFIRENVVSVIGFIIDFIVIDAMGELGLILSLVSGIILSLAITVGCYFIDRMILNKKFNIE